MLGISCFLNLILPFLGETNTEQPEQVAISGFNIDSCFN